MIEHYTGPDIQIECDYLRLQTLRDIHCLQTVRRMLPDNATVRAELAFKQGLYLRLTREREWP
jgi:hypothetical protein